MEHKLHVFGVGFYLLTIERNVPVNRRLQSATSAMMRLNKMLFVERKILANIHGGVRDARRRGDDGHG